MGTSIGVSPTRTMSLKKRTGVVKLPVRTELLINLKKSFLKPDFVQSLFSRSTVYISANSAGEPSGCKYFLTSLELKHKDVLVKIIETDTLMTLTRAEREVVRPLIIQVIGKPPKKRWDDCTFERQKFDACDTAFFDSPLNVMMNSCIGKFIIESVGAEHIAKIFDSWLAKK